MGELTYPRCGQGRPLGNDIRDDPLMRRKKEAAKERSVDRGSSRCQNLELCIFEEQRGVCDQKVEIKCEKNRWNRQVGSGHSDLETLAGRTRSRSAFDSHCHEKQLEGNKQECNTYDLSSLGIMLLAVGKIDVSR